jgi:hypothetical protein
MVHREDGEWVQRASGLFEPARAGRPSEAAGETGDGPKLDPVPYVITAVPFLVPLVAISLLEDPAVLRVLLWQGNLIAIFVAMLQAFLPLLIAPAVFVTIDRYLVPHVFRTATVPALAVAGALLIFTPLNAAIVEFGLLAAFFALVRLRGSSRARRHTVTAVAVAATAFGVWLWGPGGWSSVSDVVAARTLYALPREVAVREDGSVSVYYLVASEERVTTVIGGTRAVTSISTDQIAVRLPCRHHATGTSRSLYSLVFGEQGGTAYCGELAHCLETVPDATARDDPPTIDTCVRRASRTD